MTCGVTGDPLSCSISEAYLVEDSQGVGKGLVGFVQLAEQSVNVFRVVGNGSLLKFVVS